MNLVIVFCQRFAVRKRIFKTFLVKKPVAFDPDQTMITTLIVALNHFGN